MGQALTDTRTKSIAVAWDALGPQHVDRVNALAPYFGGVLGVQYFSTSHNYDWTWAPEPKFEKLVLCEKRKGMALDTARIVARLSNLRTKRKVDTFFLCNYEMPYTFASAWALRALGARVYVMQDSKFDDYQRHLPMEFVKTLMYGPYQGAVVPGERTESYLRFLGLKGPIERGYDTGSVARLRSYLPAQRNGFADRPFLYAGRFMPKKNVAMLLRAYAGYVARVKAKPRRLVLIGQGPEEETLRAIVAAHALEPHVEFVPWADQPDVIRQMAKSLYLLLPSISEQFGNVVGEAACAGLPAIVSDNVGARDVLVTEFVSGICVTARSQEAWTQALLETAQNEDLWVRLSAGAEAAGARFDCDQFARAAAKLAAHPAQNIALEEIPPTMPVTEDAEIEALARAGWRRLAG